MSWLIWGLLFHVVMARGDPVSTRTDKVNAGHPYCNGGVAQYPHVMCWSSSSSFLGWQPKAYNCMWYTMELLSGWRWKAPRSVFTTPCNALEIDCQASYLCTVLLMYAGLGPTPPFGEDADRRTAAACLRNQCPAQAEVVDSVIAGAPNVSCPYSSMTARTEKLAPYSNPYASSILSPLNPVQVLGVVVCVGLVCCYQKSRSSQVAGNREVVVGPSGEFGVWREQE